MNEYILLVPSTQRTADWFRFVKESLNHVDDVDLLIVDFNEVRLWKRMILLY
ncbi:hypothetical protein [Tamlana sp. I1]|uniref:hypothetical protein n=1 Tax=Tamlana sp. I1 TaxID=2762061 RepID=UPI00188FED9E|nr:hypothetical protein [Tamlana sp. I1]